MKIPIILVNFLTFWIHKISEVEMAKLEIVSLESKMNSKFYRNVSLTLSPIGENFYSLNFTAQLLVSMEGGYFSMVTTMSENRRFQCTDTKLFETRLNLCHLNKLVKFNILTEMIFKSLIAASSIPIMCPYEPQFVRITNLYLGLPPVPLPLPFPSGYFCVTLKIFARTKGTKKIEHFATFEARLFFEKTNFLPDNFEIPTIPGFKLPS